MKKIEGVTQKTENAHLNFYEVSAVKRNGETFPYYVASRAKSVEELEMVSGKDAPDGVIIFALAGEEKKVVLLRQYRYPVGDYVYEFPAGLVENGEDMYLAAIRECREETGLTLHPLEADPIYTRPYYSTDGMTDESVGIVYGYAEGELTNRGQEETEDIQVLLADRKEVARILREEKVALPTAYRLMNYLQDEDPFAFLNAEIRQSEKESGNE